MTIDTILDDSTGILIQRCSGVVTMAEITAALDRYYQAEDMPERVLWDLDAVVNLQLTGSDARAVALHAERYAETGQLRRGRRAMFATTNVTFGLAKMVEAYRTLSPDLDVYESAAFRNRDEAIAWLMALDDEVDASDSDASS